MTRSFIIEAAEEKALPALIHAVIATEPDTITGNRSSMVHGKRICPAPRFVQQCLTHKKHLMSEKKRNIDCPFRMREIMSHMSLLANLAETAFLEHVRLWPNRNEVRLSKDGWIIESAEQVL